jgi:choline dehydrogenase-like flavoprotein
MMLKQTFLYSEMIDKDIAIQGAKYARKIAETAPFSAEIDSLVYPGTNVTTDEEWGDFIASTINQPYHPTGMHFTLARSTLTQSLRSSRYECHVAQGLRRCG